MQVGRDLGGFEPQVVFTECSSEGAFGIHFTDERSTSAARRNVGKRCSNRRLADAALAGDPEHVEVEEGGHVVQRRVTR